jgi:hypothetical protein
VKALLVTLLVVAGVHTAHAYPQYQLARDQMCASCHLSPAGGNLLNENGYAVAEGVSQLGTAPEFMYGKIPTPSWLALGGDFRGATGYLKTPENVLATFPMQIELYAAATLPSGLSLHLTFGPRPSTVGNEAATHVWGREDYLMWQQKPGETEGLYVRAGRFMPVIGLRLAEHTVYTRRYGGTALWAETYGLAAEYVTQKLEVHATGFIKDPLLDTPEHYSGGAGYVELRPTETLAVGAETMVEVSKADKRYRGGLTSKLYVPSADLLLQGELQLVNQVIDSPDGRGAPVQFVSYLLASRMLGEFLLLDVGFGHFDPSMKLGSKHPGVAGDERTCVDLNFHYFTTSHVEFVLNSRYESIGFGDGGKPGAYAILQMHYRL